MLGHKSKHFFAVVVVAILLPLVVLGYIDSEYHSSRPGTLVAAVKLAVEYAKGGVYEELHCPDTQRIGVRPNSHKVTLMGTTCEGWLNRNMVALLSHYLQPTMLGMEWSCGSGTVWLLRRLAKLYSVEDNGGWLNSTKNLISSSLPWLLDKWVPMLRQFPPGSIPHIGAPDRIASEYVKALANEIRPSMERGFDFVQDDGRERTACLREAMMPGMLAEFGVFLLDNSERKRYNDSDIPSHFLVVSFVNEVDETTLYMSCPPMNRHCARAKVEIHEELRRVPDIVGPRYSKRMGKFT
jgi:hypothetical protein